MDTNTVKPAKRSALDKFLTGIETVGNNMCDPVTIFLVIIVAFMIVSAILTATGVQAVHPGTGEVHTANNLLSKDGLRWFISNVSANFQNFPPLTQVMIVMLGVGVAEKTGFLSIFLRNLALRIPRNMVTFTMAFIGMNAVAAGDSGPIVLPPLGAAIFYSLGRHPIAGLILGYASTTVGFAACVIVQMGDVIASSFTIPAAQLMDPSFNASPAMNYYFMAVSAAFLAFVLTFVNNSIIEPRLGKYESAAVEMEADLTEQEQQAFKKAALVALIFIVCVALLCLGNDPFMAKPGSGGDLLASDSPLMKGIVPLITVLFFIPGTIYGVYTGQIKNDKDVAGLMADAMRTMGGYFVMAFAASQLLGIFNYSKLGIIIAIKGAEFLEMIGLQGVPLMVVFIVLTFFIDLFLGSAGAKWAIMAPIFVPMFMLMGYHPAFTQLIYRVGDSLANGITPLSSSLPLVIAYAKRYEKDFGIGSIMSNMVPYVGVVFLMWTALIAVFMIFDLPIGPTGQIYL